MSTISSEAAKDFQEYKRAWSHWYVQLGHICDSTEDWAFYKKLEAFIQGKILDEQYKFDREQAHDMENQTDLEDSKQRHEEYMKELNQ